MRPLTKRQHDVLEAIELLLKKGYGPSFTEIAEHVGLKSVASIHNHVRVLVSRGYLKRHGFNSKRALQIVQARKVVEPRMER